MFNRLNLSDKIRPAIAIRGSHFQGITDRLAALSFVDHDLPFESGNGIKEVTVKRRAQNLCQLRDHVRFAGRLVLVNQCLLVRTIFNAFPLQKRISA